MSLHCKVINLARMYVCVGDPSLCLGKISCGPVPDEAANFCVHIPVVVIWAWTLEKYVHSCASSEDSFIAQNSGSLIKLLTAPIRSSQELWCLQADIDSF